jgi:hypothetical protein
MSGWIYLLSMQCREVQYGCEARNSCASNLGSLLGHYKVEQSRIWVNRHTLKVPKPHKTAYIKTHADARKPNLHNCKTFIHRFDSDRRLQTTLA